METKIGNLKKHNSRNLPPTPFMPSPFGLRSPSVMGERMESNIGGLKKHKSRNARRVLHTFTLKKHKSRNLSYLR